MLNTVAVSNDNDTGLSQEEMRIATALIHCRFRGLFSGITHERKNDCGPGLIIWGTSRSDDPWLKINRSNERVVVTDEVTGQEYVADTVEAVLEVTRDDFPQITAL